MNRPKIRFRALDGIVLLDKPAGMSSNAALQVARRLFRAEKGGHTGSLDPLATGLLPLCLGEATKLAGHLLGSDKAYEATIALGTTTDTDDAEGQVLVQRPLPPLDVARVEQALRPLTGLIQQRAPVYSALKQGGEPLYARARRGEVIQAPVREVRVHAIRLLELAADRLRLEVTCGSGTYIRSLARDLGEALGCGAHITGLRRLWVDPFRQPRMWRVEELQALAGQGDHALMSALLPLDAGLAAFARVDLDPVQSLRFAQGQRLRGDWGEAADTVAVWGGDGLPLGLGRIESGGCLAPQRRFNLAGEIPGVEAVTKI
jgi:tRNA pseudouridine55 synthase